MGNSFLLRSNLDYEQCNGAVAQKMDDTSRCFAICGVTIRPESWLCNFCDLRLTRSISGLNKESN